MIDNIENDPNVWLDIFNSISDGILSINRDWVITYLNLRAARDDPEYRAAIIGRKLWDTFPDLIGTPLEAHYRRVMEERIPAQFEMKGVQRDVWYLINVYPSPEGITVLWLDNTTRKQTELEFMHLLVENQRQRALLKAVFEADPSGIAVLAGPELEFAYANPVYRYITPDPSIDPIGKTYAEIWTHQSKHAIRDRCRQVLETGQPFQIVGIEHTLAGAKHKFTLQARRLVWDVRPAVLLILWDITEQKQAEQALRVSEEKFSRIFEQAAVAAALSRLPDGRLIDVNAAWVELFGYSKEEAVGKTTLELNINPTAAARARITAELMETGSVHNLETTLLTRSGEERIFILDIDLLEIGEERYILNLVHDITDQKRAEAALRESEERFRMMFEGHRAVMLLLEPASGAIVDANQAAADFYGYSREKLRTMRIEEINQLPPEEVVARRRSAVDLITNRFIFPHRLANGQVRQVEVYSSPVNIQNRPMLFSVIHDITARREMERALQESQQRFDLALRDSHIFMYTTDRALRYTWVYNPHQGLGPDHFLGKTDQEVMLGHDVSELTALKRKVLQSGVKERREIRIQFNDELHYYDLSVEPIVAADGQVSGLIGVSVDMTERKQLEERMQADLARIEVQRRLLEHREQERLQIARDLHDGPIQDLVAASIAVNGLITELQNYPDAAAATASALEELITTINQQIEELRAYAQEVRPPVLINFGFDRALRAHLENWQRKNPSIELEYTCLQPEKTLPERLLLPLYRIYQETLNNIARHSGASRVSILLEKQAVGRDGSPVVRLTIRDNGRGFEMPADWLDLAREGHLGLVGIRERAEAIGGGLEIQSTPGQGACMCLTVPL